MRDDYRILKRFFSRKNEVYLVKSDDNLYVLKRFIDPQRADTEWNFLTSLYGRFKVPKPLTKKENDVWMEYIDGGLISESLTEKALMGLAAWLARLHSFGIRKGDCILRNFIITVDGIYGIDWEEASMSSEFKGDLIDVCGSIIWIYQSNIEEGLRVCDGFLEHYRNYSGMKLNGLIEGLLSFFSKRLELRPELRDKISRILGDLEVHS